MRRVERAAGPVKRPALTRRRPPFAQPAPSAEPASGHPDLALAYSNGYVTVEISHDALEAYVQRHGDVPLPVAHDAATGDRRTYDSRNSVRVVYDADAQLREVSTRSRDGLFVRLNFVDD